MHTFVKPNGTEIKINDNSVEYALSLGWKPKEAEKSDIDLLREEYERVTGNKPHHKMGQAALLKAIENGDSRTGS